ATSVPGGPISPRIVDNAVSRTPNRARRARARPPTSRRGEDPMKRSHAPGRPRRRLLSTALMVALAPPATQALAQEAPPAADPVQEVDAVVVTGIRASLASSMNLKRDAQGVVDGIVAEDIGKFPDTNLAEALQRISGV